MEMTPLKPCPYCGSTKVTFVYDFDLVPHGVYCPGCKTKASWGMEFPKKMTFGEMMEQIAERWNRREAKTWK